MSLRKRELVALLLIVFLMSSGCKCSVSLSGGAMGWSAVYDCGISWSYSLTHCIHNLTVL